MHHYAFVSHPSGVDLDGTPGDDALALYVDGALVTPGTNVTGYATDLTNSASYFAFTSEQLVDDQIVLTWPSASNRLYNLSFRTNLLNSSETELDTNMPATPLPAGGTGNITNDPMFMDMVNSNYQLAAGSPCRDTGNNAFAPAGPDLDDNPRIVNGYVDIGAYEYQGSPQGDYDGDGNGNGDEGIAGTDFANSNDVFEISSVSVMNPASITFDSVTGRVYAVDRNDALIPEPQVWTELTNNIPGTGSAIIINDPLPGTNRNYRVRVQLQ